MYLLTTPYTFQNTDAVITLSGTTDAGMAIDGDLTTYAETANRSPYLIIDLGARKVIDALYVKGKNLQDYHVQASNRNGAYTNIRTGIKAPAHGNSFIIFQNTQAYRYWRLSFSQRGASDPNYRVGEVFLMRLLLDLNTDEKRPLHYRPSIPRTGVVAYDTYNGITVQYNAQEKEKTRLELEWANLDADMADSLESLWRGPPHAPVLTVYPRPNAEPEDIFVARWHPEVGFRFAGSFRGFGKQGRAVFEEV